MEVLIASNNLGKVERFKNLLSHTKLAVKLYTPLDLGIEATNVPENADTLEENAKQKAQAYFGKVSIPILSNDTGFYVEGEGLVIAPKRAALGENAEHTLSEQEISDKLIGFWKDIATKHGGKVDAAWIEVFFILYPDGITRKTNSRREVILTNTEFGEPHIQMPLRALYISKTTGKPAVLHTPEEEVLELQPVTDALIKIFEH